MLEILLLGSVVGDACQAPNPIELALIIALISGIGVFSIASGLAIVSVVNTIVALLLSGASVGAIVAAISGDAVVTSGSLEVITQMVIMIKGILGC
jgi:hypothetical protein